MGWKYGDTKPVLSKAVPTATVVQIGDLVGQAANGDPYSAADEAWDTNLSTTQTNFAAAFLGASGQRSRDGDTDPIRVNTSGVHEFACASDVFQIGQFVGAAKASGNALLSQTVVKVDTAAEAIGVVSASYQSATTTVKVELASDIMEGITSGA